MSVNKAILIGHLGKDPQLKTTQSGKSVCSFSLATNERYNNEDHTTWHNIVAWGKQAEVINQYLHKGSQVFIEGRINNRGYEDGDGNKKYISEVIVRDFTFLGGRDSNESPRTAKVKVNDFDDYDDLPF